ncbi:MAG TPA: methyltransferase domain-containing protein [Acidobacteriaceae bacterium]|nr:methyltransferase domain-containing protein [Acidobacteriaceae bacterium]
MAEIAPLQPQVDRARGDDTGGDHTWFDEPAQFGSPQFDRVARLYRWMEYLSFGPWLERCRFAHLAAVAGAVPQKALAFGDGDGRFLTRLLAANPALHAEAVDLSPAMLRLLGDRAGGAGAESRLTTTCADVRTFTPPGSGYDLVVTHFFLDCLSPAETAALIARVRPHLAPGAVWLVSEFEVATASRLRALLARGVIAFLYAAFRVLTGLGVRRIPPWRALLAGAGFTPQASRGFLGGLLVSELWRFEATASCSGLSHERMTLSAAALNRPTSIPGIDPGPEPFPGLPPMPHPDPAPGPAPEPDPEPYPGPIPAPQPVTRNV